MPVGGEFHTPEVVMVRSGVGLGGISRTMHRLFNDHLMPRTWATKVPPILLNTWEALYFAIDHHSVVELAQYVSDQYISAILYILIIVHN